MSEQLREAAQQALEALEENGRLSAIAILRAALEQPEPVAWRNAALRVGEDLCSVGPFGYYNMTAKQWLDWALSVVTVHAPPRREWRGLTDKEIGDAFNATNDYNAFARAIEKALKEKNSA